MRGFTLASESVFLSESTQCCNAAEAQLLVLLLEIYTLIDPPNKETVYRMALYDSVMLNLFDLI